MMKQEPVADTLLFGIFRGAAGDEPCSKKDVRNTDYVACRSKEMCDDRGPD